MPRKKKMPRSIFPDTTKKELILNLLAAKPDVKFSDARQELHAKYGIEIVNSQFHNLKKQFLAEQEAPPEKENYFEELDPAAPGTAAEDAGYQLDNDKGEDDCYFTVDDAIDLIKAHGGIHGARAQADRLEKAIRIAQAYRDDLSDLFSETEES